MFETEEPGVALMILWNLGIDPVRLVQDLERHGSERQPNLAPHLIVEGARYHEMLAAAEEEARRMACAFVGTEHLLLAAMTGAGGATRDSLADQAVTPAAIRREARAILGLDETAGAETRPVRRAASRTDATTEPTTATNFRIHPADLAPSDAPLPERIEALLSQMAVWSRHPDILERFSKLNQLLAEATNRAVHELSSMDLPEELVQPAIDVFALTQEKSQVVALSDYARAKELQERIEAIMQEQAHMPAEQAQLAGELIETERQKQAAVAEEHYEHAAVCRDRSRELRRQWDALQKQPRLSTEK
jgi:hypothetical protein